MGLNRRQNEFRNLKTLPEFLQKCKGLESSGWVIYFSVGSYINKKFCLKFYFNTNDDMRRDIMYTKVIFCFKKWEARKEIHLH